MEKFEETFIKYYLPICSIEEIKVFFYLKDKLDEECYGEFDLDDLCFELMMSAEDILRGVNSLQSRGLLKISAVDFEERLVIFHLAAKRLKRKLEQIEEEQEEDDDDEEDIDPELQAQVIEEAEILNNILKIEIQTEFSELDSAVLKYKDTLKALFLQIEIFTNFEEQIKENIPDAEQRKKIIDFNATTIEKLNSLLLQHLEVLRGMN